jgi:hypothetical protein
VKKHHEKYLKELSIIHRENLGISSEHINRVMGWFEAINRIMG